MNFQKFIFDVKPHNLIVEIESLNEVDALDYLHLCRFDDVNSTLRCPKSDLAKILYIKKNDQLDFNNGSYSSNFKNDNYGQLAKPVNLRKRGRGYEWTEEETNALVSICKQRRFEEVKLPGEKRTFKWQSVVDAMAIEGFERSVVEVKAKWKREVKKSESLLNQKESNYDDNEFEFDHPIVLGTQDGLFELHPVKKCHTDIKSDHSSPADISHFMNTSGSAYDNELQDVRETPSPVEILFTMHPSVEKGRKRGKGCQWSDAATETLINICRMRLIRDPKSPMIKGVSKWRDVSLAMAHEGHEKTVDEVKAKWDREKRKFLADNTGIYPYSEQMREILLKLESSESESITNMDAKISKSNNIIDNLREKYKQARLPKTLLLNDEAKKTRLFGEYLKLEKQKYELKKEALEESKRFHDSLITIGESLLNAFKQNSNAQSST